MDYCSDILKIWSNYSWTGNMGIWHIEQTVILWQNSVYKVVQVWCILNKGTQFVKVPILINLWISFAAVSIWIHWQKVFISNVLLKNKNKIVSTIFHLQLRSWVVYHQLNIASPIIVGTGFFLNTTFSNSNSLLALPNITKVLPIIRQKKQEKKQKKKEKEHTQ